MAETPRNGRRWREGHAPTRPCVEFFGLSRRPRQARVGRLACMTACRTSDGSRVGGRGRRASGGSPAPATAAERARRQPLHGQAAPSSRRAGVLPGTAAAAARSETRLYCAARAASVQRYGRGGDTAEECYRRGLEQAARGDHTGAAASHAEAVRLDPSHAAAHEGRGMALLEIERFATARRSLARAARLGGPTPALCMAMGRALSEMGMGAEAVRRYRRAARMDPALAEARIEAARELEAMGRIDEARTELDRAIKASPTSAAACLAKAGMLARHERDGGASELYDRAIELDPASADAHAGRSRMLWRDGVDKEGALASIREAIRLRPGSAGLRSIEGRMMASIDRDGEAIESLGRAHELCPDDPDALCDMAESLEKEGRTEEALAAYEESARRSDGGGIARLLRGELLAKAGRHREAVADFDECIRIGMDGVDARLYKGDSLRALGDARGAARSYRKGLEEFPRSAELCRGMAAALGDLGRAKDAARYRARAEAYAERDAELVRSLKGTIKDEDREEFGAMVRDWAFSKP